MRKSGFDIPAKPTRECVMKAMNSVDKMVSSLGYELERIPDLLESNLNESTREVMKIYDSIYLSSMVLNSPFRELNNDILFLFVCFASHAAPLSFSRILKSNPTYYGETGCLAVPTT